MRVGFDTLGYVLAPAGLCGIGTAAHARTATAASCSVADVQAAVAAGADGDTVLVPAGGCTWTSALTISVGLTLDGQGAAIITFGAGGGLTIDADPVASTVVTGFTFDNGFTNGSFPIAVNTTSAPFNAPFRISNDSLSDDGRQGGPVTLIGILGFGPGLIDHDTFTTANGADEVIHLLGSGDPSDASGWSDDVVPGGPDMVFLENDLFTNTSTDVSTSAEEAYYGARLVFRHNTLSFEANDVHQGGLSGRWAEIYDNTYEINGSSIPLSAYWQFRGGSGVVFDNVSSEAPCCEDPYPGAQFGPDCPSSDTCTGAWPIPTQVGTGIGQTTNSPVYVWSNDGTIEGSTQSIQGSLDYTNGTEAGATATSCTHPGGLCDVVVTASPPASWVRCQSAADVSAGCPVAYTYTPYTYPHPLDDRSAACVGAGCPFASGSGTGGSSGGSAATAGGSGGGTTAAGSSSGGAGNFGSGSTSGSGAATGNGTGRSTSGGSVASSGSAGRGGTAAPDAGGTARGGCGCNSGSAGEVIVGMFLALGLLSSRRRSGR